MSPAPDAQTAAPSLSTIPSVRSQRSIAECLRALDQLSRKGKLPGYEPRGSDAFKVSLFGEPFDRDLIGSMKSLANGCEISFQTSLRMKAPLILAISIIVSIWPGVELMDALIPASWGWIDTWMWYMPLMIVPLPIFLPVMWRKSNKAAADHLGEQLERIRTAVDGRTA